MLLCNKPIQNITWLLYDYFCDESANQVIIVHPTLSKKIIPFLKNKIFNSMPTAEKNDRDGDSNPGHPDGKSKLE